jgi:hypothetical protein
MVNQSWVSRFRVTHTLQLQLLLLQSLNVESDKPYDGMA